LRELGWIEGQNIVVERRWADTHEDRLPALMNDVLARGVTVIVTVGTPAALAATRATSTIPIVRSSQVALRVGRTDSLVEGSPALTKSLNS
jgi:putative ABC transport system substrate-binding protein